MSAARTVLIIGDEDSRASIGALLESEGYGVASSIEHQPEYQAVQDVPVIMLSSIHHNPD